jgi:hypothetical protein
MQPPSLGRPGQWIAIRIISHGDRRTLREYTTARPEKVVPAVTMGNRAALENQPVPGAMKIIIYSIIQDFLISIFTVLKKNNLFKSRKR